MTRITTSKHQLRAGDIVTLPGVVTPDRRSRARRLWDWIYRRPSAPPMRTAFVITDIVGGTFSIAPDGEDV